MKHSLRISGICLMLFGVLLMGGCRQIWFSHEGGSSEVDSGGDNGGDGGGGTDLPSKSITITGASIVDAKHQGLPTSLYGAYYTIELTAEVTGEDSSDTACIQWASSDENLATVTGTGTTATVEGKARGDVRITATTSDGATSAIHDIRVYESMVIQWDVPVGDTEVVLPLRVQGADTWEYIIDWGDESGLSTIVSDDYGSGVYPSHDYGTAGTYTMRLLTLDEALGIQPWNFFSVPSASSSKLVDVLRFGGATLGESTFANCTNLTQFSADDTPRLGVSMKYMFFRASNFNQDLSGWNVGDVTDMEHMFFEATSFQGALDWEDTSSLTNVKGMFESASSFNQDISGWNVSSITNMNRMFYGASSFNKPLHWGAATNGVTDMEYMFYGCGAFNQDLSEWNVSGVTTMTYMFQGATNFNNASQPLTWGNDTHQVQNMGFMFADASNFNQDISQWNVSSVQFMTNMFSGATNFNNAGSPLTWGEHTSNVKRMTSMFADAINFNQDISQWNIASVTNMKSMFLNATAYTNNGVSLNVDAEAHGSWDLTTSSPSRYANMLETSGLPAAHYPKGY